MPELLQNFVIRIEERYRSPFLVFSDDPHQSMIAPNPSDTARNPHLRLQEDQFPESLCGPQAMSFSVNEPISGEYFADCPYLLSEVSYYDVQVHVFKKKNGNEVTVFYMAITCRQ